MKFLQSTKGKMSLWLVLFFIFSVAAGCAKKTAAPEFAVNIVPNDAEQRVDILVDGKPFTSYLYSDKIKTLKKTVLYPLRSANGTAVTRGFPLDPKPGERVDHPHQIGFWFNYGNVNGYDFWNNSDAIPPERAGKMGTIRHRKIDKIVNGKGEGELDVTMDWLIPDGTPILQENTRFIFRAAKGFRAVDRITKLTAVNGPVAFPDNKEGVIAVRVTRALEHPTNKPITVTDAAGKATEVPVLDNKGVTGHYLSSEGVEGMAVWGKRARWVMLTGTVDNELVNLAILDHPGNVGYPTYWHARGYGLFAANPLGQKIFSKGKEELNFSLADGESVTFRYRLLIRSGKTTVEEMERLYQDFLNEIK